MRIYFDNSIRYSHATACRDKSNYISSIKVDPTQDIAQNKMEYQTFEGQRSTHVNYLVGDHIYQKKAALAKGVRLRCNKWKTPNIKCLGTALLDPQTNLVTMSNPHTCRVNKLEVKTILFRTQLKNKVQSSDQKIDKIYKDLADIFGPEVKAAIPFKRVKSNLFRLRGQSVKKKKAQEEIEQGSSTKGMTVCDICTEIVTVAPVLNVPCGHGFCQTCSSKTLKKNSICPLCRRVVENTVSFFNL